MSRLPSNKGQRKLENPDKTGDAYKKIMVIP